MPEFDLDARLDPNFNGVTPHLTSMSVCSQPCFPTSFMACPTQPPSLCSPITK